MRKLIPILALIPLIILALTPPWEFQLDCTINGLFWLWMVFLSGFLTFLFLYQKVSVWLKLFLIWTYIGCFISRAPYISFTMYWSVIACAYYYALCRKIEDFTPVKKVIQAIFFFLCLLIIMQSFGLDTLLNFGIKTPCILGTIGNTQILGTFVCVLAPFLILSPLNWIALILVAFISKSVGTIIAIFAGLSVLLWKKLNFIGKYLFIVLIIIGSIFACQTAKFKTFIGPAGRIPAYLKTIELSLKSPLGYGPATEKILFPVMCGDAIKKQQPGRVWVPTHNDFLQILFETGFPGFIFFFGWLISILIKVRDPVKQAGIMILATVMMPHFPSRMCQAVLIMIMYLAFIEHKEANNA